MPIPKVGDVIVTKLVEGHSPTTHAKIDDKTWIVTAVRDCRETLFLRLRDMKTGDLLHGSPYSAAQDTFEWCFYPREITINPFLTAAHRAILDSTKENHHEPAV